MNNFATRRLWLRRWARLWSMMGIFVMLPFSFFAWYFRWWRKSGGEALVCHIIFGVLGSIVAIAVLGAYEEHQGNKIAPAAVLVAESDADACFDNTIKRRAEQWQRPVKIKDVNQLKRECKEYWENRKAMEEQAKVLKITGEAK